MNPLADPVNVYINSLLNLQPHHNALLHYLQNAEDWPIHTTDVDYRRLDQAAATLQGELHRLYLQIRAARSTLKRQYYGRGNRQPLQRAEGSGALIQEIQHAPRSRIQPRQARQRKRSRR